jgi:hypothetical protein
VEGPVAVQKTSSGKSAHLMCGSKLWTVVAFLSCAYFTKIAMGRLSLGPIAWSHDNVDIATHLVWVVFLVGLLSETRCWKEWIFFSLVLINFGLASVMGAWSSAPVTTVMKSRELSAAVWGLAAVISFLLIFTRKSRSRPKEAQQV